jgi:hypothetical protein
MIVNVTLAHITKALWLSVGANPSELGYCCPLALALTEQTGEICAVDSAFYWIDGYRYPISEQGKEFVYKFDNRRSTVEPGAVEL